ncbi:MAG: dienelactone hydrolase family protein [Roseiflexaceae bacterium]|nr:dienelactone hydrolase family protein [Roseiflexaceae bacterium]
MRIIRRVLLWVVAIIVALTLTLIASIAVEGWLGNGRVDALTNTRIANPSGPEVRAYVARPAGAGPHPTVIMVHEWWGLNEQIVKKADELAQSGYLVIAPDTLRGSSTSWIPRALYQVATADTAQVTGDVDAVYTWLGQQPDVAADRIAILGFCYGGRTALNYSLFNPQVAATATFYGMAETTPEQLRTLRGPVLGIWGGADASIPLSEVNALEANLSAADVTHTFRVFDGQPHAFVASVDQIRQPGPQQDAWNELLTFLNSALNQSASITPAQSIGGQSTGVNQTTLMGALHHVFVCKLGA